MFFNQRATMRWVSAVHAFWYRLTGGWVGGNVMGADILLLPTIGRKSGRQYTTPLLYLRDGDELVIIASNNGSDRDPDWWRNLMKQPRAEAQVMGSRRDVVASQASGEERDRLWDKIARRYPVYRQYERRTTREIPVVVLSSDEAKSSSTST